MGMGILPACTSMYYGLPGAHGAKRTLDRRNWSYR